MQNATLWRALLGIEKAVIEPSSVRRAAMYKKILAKGYEEAPAVFTVHPSGVYGMREWVRGFVDNPVNMGIYCYPIEKK